MLLPTLISFSEAWEETFLVYDKASYNERDTLTINHYISLATRYLYFNIHIVDVTFHTE